MLFPPSARHAWRMLLCSLIIGTFMLAIAPAIPVAANLSPPCTASSCNNLFPDEAVSGGFSCANPPSDYEVRDMRTATAPAGGGVIVAILRYSSWCDAYWAKGVFFSNGATSWGMDVQVTNDDYIVAAHFFDRDVPDRFTRMFSGDDDGTGTLAEACVELTDPSPAYRVCTNHVRLQFVGAGSFGTVGTDCRSPNISALNIWHFRVIGLPPPGSGTNVAAQLTDGTGGIWNNTAVYPCAYPWRWSLTSQSFVIGTAYAGIDVYVAAYPGTDLPGALPISGRTYTLTGTNTFGTPFSVTYQP